LARKLIELFQSPDVSNTSAQMLAVTHDVTLMDKSMFRRDQLWIAEKDYSGGTQLYSLHDIDDDGRPRSTEAFEKNYREGRYGGVPQFGPTFEDLEFA
jgi:AAA15 family ATPase/GTPase